VAEFTASVPARAALAARLRANKTCLLQELVDADAARELALGCPSGRCQPSEMRPSVRDVVIYDLGHVDVLRVKEYACSLCLVRVTPHPYVVGCAPTAPSNFCASWVYEEVVRLFLDQHLLNGMSADGEGAPRPWALLFSDLDSLLAPAAAPPRAAFCHSLEKMAQPAPRRPHRL
jgi:hypothetical protein